jgi:hypothetical protein
MTTTFGQLVADVITETNRPELADSGEIQLAVRSATQFWHLKDFWLKDSFEELFTFPAASYLFQLDTGENFERFRKIRYIKKYDVAAQTTREGDSDKITETDPVSLFDRYGSAKLNKYYLAGTNLNLKLSTQESALIVSWFKYPSTSPEAYASWIADMYPAAIVNSAAAKIQRSIGSTEDANRREKWAMEVDFPIVQANDVVATA